MGKLKRGKCPKENEMRAAIIALVATATIALVVATAIIALIAPLSAFAQGNPNKEEKEIPTAEELASKRAAVLEKGIEKSYYATAAATSESQIEELDYSLWNFARAVVGLDSAIVLNGRKEVTSFWTLDIGVNISLIAERVLDLSLKFGIGFVRPDSGFDGETTLWLLRPKVEMGYFATDWMRISFRLMMSLFDGRYKQLEANTIQGEVGASLDFILSPQIAIGAGVAIPFSGDGYEENWRNQVSGVPYLGLTVQAFFSGIGEKKPD